MKAYRLILLLVTALAAPACATSAPAPAVALQAANATADARAAKPPRHNYYGHVTLVRSAGPAGEPTCLIVEGAPRDCDDRTCLSAKEVSIDADLAAGKLVLKGPPTIVNQLAACVVDGVGVQLVDSSGDTRMAFSATVATSVTLQPVAPGVCEMAIKEQGLPGKKGPSK